MNIHKMTNAAGISAAAIGLFWGGNSAVVQTGQTGVRQGETGQQQTQRERPVQPGAAEQPEPRELIFPQPQRPFDRRTPLVRRLDDDRFDPRLDDPRFDDRRTFRRGMSAQQADRQLMMMEQRLGQNNERLLRQLGQVRQLSGQRQVEGLGEIIQQMLLEHSTMLDFVRSTRESILESTRDPFLEDRAFGAEDPFLDERFLDDRFGDRFADPRLRHERFREFLEEERRARGADDRRIGPQPPQIDRGSLLDREGTLLERRDPRLLERREPTPLDRRRPPRGQDTTGDRRGGDAPRSPR